MFKGEAAIAAAIHICTCLLFSNNTNKHARLRISSDKLGKYEYTVAHCKTCHNKKAVQTMEYPHKHTLKVPLAWNLRRENRTAKGAGVIARVVLEADRYYSMKALVVDGSLNGCGLVAVTEAPVQIECRCHITLADCGPINARVAWVREIDRGILRFGLQYLA